MKYLAIIVGVFFGFGAGVLYGFHLGVSNYAALESVLVSHMSTGQINRLESGTAEDLNNVNGFFQSWVDHGLDQYAWYQDKGNHFLSNILLKEHVELSEKSITSISNFRLTHPEENLESFLSSEESKKEYAEMRDRRKSIVDEFAKHQHK